MPLTEKQLKVMNSEMMRILSEIRIDLHYSLRLFEDYRSDLQSEAKSVTKVVSSARRKIKAIEEKILSNGGSLIKLK